MTPRRRNNTQARAPSGKHSAAGFSLLELLLVLLVVAIVASAAINATSVDATTAIASVAQQVSADLAYCRSLAIVHASRYEIVFLKDENRYTIRHSGPEPALHTVLAGANVSEGQGEFAVPEQTSSGSHTSPEPGLQTVPAEAT